MAEISRFLGIVISLLFYLPFLTLTTSPNLITHSIGVKTFTFADKSERNDSGGEVDEVEDG